MDRILLTCVIVIVAFLPVGTVLYVLWQKRQKKEEDCDVEAAQYLQKMYLAFGPESEDRPYRGTYFGPNAEDCLNLKMAYRRLNRRHKLGLVAPKIAEFAGKMVESTKNVRSLLPVG